MRFKEYLSVRGNLMENKKKDDTPKFIETDGRMEFPRDTINYLQKEINKNCKDLNREWKNAIEVVNHAFNELDIPIPKAFQKDRWEQYLKLLSYAVKNMHEARGFSDWTITSN